MPTFGPRALLLIIAIVCFALAAIGLRVDVSLVALGLAFGFAAFLFGDIGWSRR